MRIFNPFKPHICEFGIGGFGVRKLALIGWTYLDAKENYWWHGHQYIYHTVFSSPGFASDRIQEYKNKPKFSKLYAY